MMKFFDNVWHKWLRRPYGLHIVADIGNPQGTPVVLLHGIASEGEAWRPLIDRIDSRKHRIIVLDLLGFGHSPQPDHILYNVEDHVRAVMWTLQKLGVMRFSKGSKRPKITIIAHSMGCLIATHIATRHRGMIKRLMLYEPPLYADDPTYRSHRKQAARYLAFYDYLANHPELLMLQHKRLYRIAQKVSGIILSQDHWLPFERSLRNTIMHQTAFKELHAIRVPTDIVHGRLDFVVVRAEVKKMFAANPHITLYTVTAFHDINQRAAVYLNTLLEKTVRPARARKP
jgi:cis-3-alkyl-4-acyloxetan-2-one decarboxylase